MLAAVMVVAVVLACCSDLGGGERSRSAPIDVPESWQAARSTPGHVVHVSQRGLACGECHALSGSELGEPDLASCRRCHEAQASTEHASERARPGEAARSDCLSCHAFEAPEPHHAAPGAWDCPRCHGAPPTGGTRAVAAAPDGLSIRAHATADCRACHDPHAEPPARAADCRRCHSELPSWHAPGAPPAAQRAAARAGRAVAAGPGAKATRAALLETSSPAALPCRDCHRDVHSPASVALDGCLDCHAPSGPMRPQAGGAAPSARGHAALFDGGHPRCTTCHEPHSGSVQRACADCHRRPAALAAERVPDHAACTACHDPHDRGRDPASACESCHGSLNADHPARPGQGRCTGCHEPHPARDGHGGARACSDCHREAASDRAYHAGNLACTSCHAPHDFLLDAAASDCGRCHAAELQSATAQRGHARCVQCHQGAPHHVDAPPRACASCHAAQAVRVVGGHASCRGCHQTHSGEVMHDCRSCHAAEAASAPRGHHDCQSCHEPHGGGLGGRGCSDCHAEQAASGPHHALPGGCQSCHRPHGPAGSATAPACASCHEPTRLDNLHAVPGHRDCGQCHRGHDAFVGSEPVTCRSCHVDRASHFPDARRCSGCHQF